MTRDDLVARGLIQLRALLANPDQRATWRDTTQQLLDDLAKDLAAAEPTLVTKESLAIAVEAVWRRFVLHGEDHGDVAERHASWLAQGQLDQGLAYPRSLRVITTKKKSWQ